jgi:hypothetical protein
VNLQPITRREAFAFIVAHHRHHLPPQGFKFAIATADAGAVVGVITVGRPIARHFDNGYTAEVTRCCVAEGHPNVSSKLYAAAWRAARAMGYTRLVTYTLASESGVSLRAAGWRVVAQTSGGSWHREARPRVDLHPIGQKTLWQAV